MAKDGKDKKENVSDDFIKEIEQIQERRTQSQKSKSEKRDFTKEVEEVLRWLSPIVRAFVEMDALLAFNEFDKGFYITYANSIIYGLFIESNSSQSILVREETRNVYYNPFTKTIYSGKPIRRPIEDAVQKGLKDWYSSL